MIRSCGKTGMMRVIPVLFYVLIVGLTAVLSAGPLHAAPPEEKLPDLSKPKLHREETDLEKAVNRAAAMLLQGKLPASEDGVRFALWLYGDKGDVAYLDIATKMARELVKVDLTLGSAALFWVAQAGGPTLEEAKIREVEVYRDEPKVMARQLTWVAGIAAKRETPHTGPPFTTNSDRGSMNTLVTQLRMWLEFGQLQGGPSAEGASRETAKEIVDKFRDSSTGQCKDPGASNSMIKRDNARAALVLWEAGTIYQDANLRKLGQDALESDLEVALQDPNAAAIAG